MAPSALVPAVLLALACTIRPQTVDPGEKPDDGGGDGGADGGADTGPIDTGPPLPCDVPEAEPNSPYDQANALPMEAWACGTFSEAGDLTEIMRFENDEPAWLRIWARAFEIGSLADLTLSISAGNGPYGASRLSNPDSTDAQMVFPVDDSYEFYVTLTEAYGRSGESYRWELMASEVKAPVVYNRVEAEGNDSSSTAELVAHGDRVFAYMDTAVDIDWFALELPEGRSDVTLDVDAWYFGSPANVRVELYDPSGTRFLGSSGDSSTGDTNYDPRLVGSPTQGGTWTIKVQPEPGSSESGGGAAFWYVLDVAVEQ